VFDVISVQVNGKPPKFPSKHSNTALSRHQAQKRTQKNTVRLETWVA
jgi:hypothetical protein